VGSIPSRPCQQFFNPGLQKKINKALSVRVIVICSDHRVLWRDSCKGVDRALKPDESILHKIIIIIINLRHQTSSFKLWEVVKFNKTFEELSKMQMDTKKTEEDIELLHGQSQTCVQKGKYFLIVQIKYLVSFGLFKRHYFRNQKILYFTNQSTIQNKLLDM